MAPTKMTRIAAAIGLAFAATSFASLPATAQEGNVVRNILGAMGLMNPEKPNIEYRERPPLVVPPSRELPPPVSAEALQANPEWPEDATRRAEQERLAGSGPRDGLLTIDEMRAGRRAGVGGGGYSIPMDDIESMRPLTRDELRINPTTDEASQGLTRRYLTDPPSAFLQPAPSN